MQLLRYLGYHYFQGAFEASPLVSSGKLIRKVRNQISRTMFEAAIWWQATSRARDYPRVLFFPSGEREGASLLRAYNIAEALRARGWTAAAVPPTVKLSGRKRIIRRFRPDLLVFQQCRHPLNTGSLAFGIPYVVDTDDADFHLEIEGLSERLESTVRQATGVIAGSRYIRDHHKRFNGNVEVIWTGAPIRNECWTSHRDRQRDDGLIVTWAQARPLDYPKELEFVVKLDSRLRAMGSHHTLRLYGVDSASDGAELEKRFGANCRLELLPTLSYDAFVESLRHASVGLCPLVTAAPFSRGKSFGKILAYLEAGVPVVASDAADHKIFFEPNTGIVSNDPERWEQAVLALLADPRRRDEMAQRADALLRRRLSLDAAAELTDKYLRKTIQACVGQVREV